MRLDMEIDRYETKNKFQVSVAVHMFADDSDAPKLSLVTLTDLKFNI